MFSVAVLFGVVVTVLVLVALLGYGAWLFNCYLWRLPASVKFVTQVFQVGIMAKDPTKIILHFNTVEYFTRGVVVEASEWLRYGVPNKTEVFIVTDGLSHYIRVQGRARLIYLDPILV
ncbi:hypothetical protein D3C75_1104840 [compost metagenome]